MHKPFKPLRTLRFQYLKFFPKTEVQEYLGYVQYMDNAANDYVKSSLLESKPLMVSKFGTVELSVLRNYRTVNRIPSIRALVNYTQGDTYAWWWETLETLSNNAGVFPKSEQVAMQFAKLMLDDIKQIDIFGSYIKEEKDFEKELSSSVKINLDGYLAPFFYENPWTEALKGKKVLVIHPFEESIRKQYEKRHLLFENKNVLPDFELKTIKAVQSVGYQPTEFQDWFEALDSMKTKINETDFDIALIGCGAYGMPLAAHVKRIGKQAVHLAGWTQVLFGITGRRWEEHDTRMKHLINEHWVRPLESEKPANFKQVEDGCYW